MMTMIGDAGGHTEGDGEGGERENINSAVAGNPITSVYRGRRRIDIGSPPTMSQDTSAATNTGLEDPKRQRGR